MKFSILASAHRATASLLLLIPCIYIIGISACKQQPKEKIVGYDEEKTLTADKPVMQLLSASETGIDFQNQVIETYENNITSNLNTYNGGGLAVADINNDGLQDIYFISSSGVNKLYLNQGGMKFKDITQTAGVASEGGFETGVSAVDINSDGLLDLYVCRAGVLEDNDRRNKLFVNNGNLTFTEKAAEYGLNDISASTGANFFDMDNDGDLDCYVLNYPADQTWAAKIESKKNSDGKFRPDLSPRAPYDTDRLYRNDNGKFTDVSKEAGIWNLGYGLSVSVSDFNYDGWPDIYVANDFVQPDNLYINNKNGTFTDKIRDYLKHSSQHSMGTDINDFDNDGLLDLYVVDMLAATNYRQKTLGAVNSQSRLTALLQNGYFYPVVRNVLQHNNGNGTFSDVACMAGVFETDWSWSGLFFDIDNDGLRDLHVSNGYRRETTNRDFIDFILPDLKKEGAGKRIQDVYPNVNDFLKNIPEYKVRNFCYQNKGNMQFADVSGNWMTIPPSWSCGTAWADLDNDGDLDMVVNNLEEPAFVYENKTKGQSGNHYLQAKLQGNAQNPFAIGASVLISYNNGQKQYQELYPTRGIFSSVEHLIHFGLGNQTTIDQLVVRWPDGKAQTLTNVSADQRLTLKYTDATERREPLGKPNAANALVKEQSAALGLNFVHEENDYNDFEFWPLNPWKETELGPALATGDVNGDGLDDLYIGNSFEKTGALFVQTAAGKFVKTAQKTWETDKLYEDHGALFFDADNDNDLDLFIVSGGIEATSPLAWQNRLYINSDGKGNFVKAPSAIPQSQDVAMRAVAYDYDHDGDNDLFIGGRVTPTKWPLIPRSLVLRNDRNKFTDATAEAAPAFERCGMVSDLTWADLDGDQQPELIAVGEWMPVTVFKLNGGKLEDITANLGLSQSNGLWNRLQVADLDKDGDLDLVTGNLGLNTRYKASPNAPFRCYAKDFDNNGTLDPIMAFYENGAIYPLALKADITKQIPSLKKKFLYAKEYGNATIDKVFSQSDLDAALNLNCYMLETCWWENQGGKFVPHILPNQAQTSVTEGIAVDDFNQDGNPDIILVGNKLGMDAETNSCDAGIGSILYGDGKGGFQWANNLQTGFWAMMEARDVAVLKSAGNKKVYIVANNNGPLQAYGK